MGLEVELGVFNDTGAKFVSLEFWGSIEPWESEMRVI